MIAIIPDRWELQELEKELEKRFPFPVEVRRRKDLPPMRGMLVVDRHELEDPYWQRVEEVAGFLSELSVYASLEVKGLTIREDEL